MKITSHAWNIQFIDLVLVQQYHSKMQSVTSIVFTTAFRKHLETWLFLWCFYCHLSYLILSFILFLVVNMKQTSWIPCYCLKVCRRRVENRMQNVLSFRKACQAGEQVLINGLPFDIIWLSSASMQRHNVFLTWWHLLLLHIDNLFWFCLVPRCWKLTFVMIVLQKSMSMKKL